MVLHLKRHYLRCTQRFSFLCKIPEKSKAIFENHTSLGFVVACMTNISHILEHLSTWFPVGGALWVGIEGVVLLEEVCYGGRGRL